MKTHSAGIFLYLEASINREEGKITAKHHRKFKFVSYFCEPTSVLEISLFILFLLDVECDTIVVFV